MTVDGILPIFLVGCFGGLLAEIAKWYQLRESLELPSYLRHPSYWLITFLIIVAGGGLAVLYGVDKKSAILVANIGLTAPLIIRALAGTIPVQIGADHEFKPAVLPRKTVLEDKEHLNRAQRRKIRPEPQRRGQPIRKMKKSSIDRRYGDGDSSLGVRHGYDDDSYSGDIVARASRQQLSGEEKVSPITLRSVVNFLAGR